MVKFHFIRYQKERKQSQTGEVKVSNKKLNANTKVVKKIKKSLKEIVVEEEEEEIIIQPKKKSIKPQV